jgi:hypothetical protein
LSFDHIFRGNLTALARGASVGTARIIPEILRRYHYLPEFAIQIEMCWHVKNHAIQRRIKNV